MAGLIQSEQVNHPDEINIGARVASDIFSCGAAEIGWQAREQAWDDYMDDQDLLSQYEQNLNTISGEITSSQNAITSYEWKLQDLAHQKQESEDFLEDYRQMLAGEGDDDNTLLLTDQLNQANITNAENELAAYKDSSALEMDSLIRSGFDEYTSQRQNQALANIYASATGSVVSAYGSAAKRVQASIRAFVGEDMRFNEEPEGTDAQGTSDGGMIGSYAKSILSTRTTIRNNIAQLESSVKAAEIAFQDFRDQMEDAAYENQTFLDRYGQMSSMYQQAIENEKQNIKDLQDTALETIEHAQNALDRVQDYEGFESDDGTIYYEYGKTTWDDLDDLYAQYGGTKK